MFKAKSKITLRSRKLVQVCSVSLLCWGSLFTPAWASLENTLETFPQDTTLLTSMDISPEKWGYFWGRKPFSETFSSPEVQEQLKEFQEKTGIDFVKELLPLLGTHVSVGYYSPNHQFDSPFSGAQDRAKQSSIKANMHTLQTMIETYAVDWGGVYPKDLAILEKEAKKSGYSYWRDFTNPYTSKKGASHTIIDIKNIKPDSKLPGQVIYIPLTDSTKQITSYFLVGLDENGKLISDNNNGSFYLTNDGTDWNKPTGTYAKELIEAKKRLPGLGQKEAPPKKTDSVIFSLDLRSGQQTQPVLEKLIKTVNQKNKNRFKSAQYRNLAYYHYTSSDSDVLNFLETESSGSEPKEEQTLSMGIVGDRLLVSLAGDEQVWKKAVDVSLDHKGGLLQEESMTSVVQAFKPNALWAYVNQKVLDQLNQGLEKSIKPANSARQSSLKANMHTLQTVLETYAVDWGGVYPKDLIALEKEAKRQSYWKEFSNPYTGKKGANQTLADIKNLKPDSNLPGRVVYVPLIGTDKQITAYYILGLDHQGKLIPDKDSKQPFSLDNFGSSIDWEKPTGTYANQLNEAKKHLPEPGSQEELPTNASEETVEKSIYHGSGLGFDIDSKGLYLSNFNAYLPGISAEQKQAASMDIGASESLLKLLQAAPAEPLFFLGISHLKQLLQGSNPLDFSKTLFDQMLPTEAQNLKEQFSNWTQLDFEKDFWQELDHQAGLMTSVFDSDPAKKWPQSVIAIGAKAPQQLAQKWIQKFAISQDKLVEAGWIHTPDQDLAENLVKFKAALESFSEQSLMLGNEANMFPANVAALNKAANSENPDFSYMGQYSLDWANPVSKEEGIGKAFVDYQSFKNSKDRSAFKGAVLYEPVGKPVYSKESKQNLVAGYKLFAYTEDGYILELKSDGTVTRPKRLSDRPWRWNSQAVETYQGSAIYGLQSNPHLVKMAQENGMSPSMSYYKQHVLLGANPEAIKQTIDHLQQSKTTLDKDPRFQSAFRRLNQDTNTGLFYFDLQSVLKKINQEMQELPEAEQEAAKEWQDYAKPLQHFSGNSSYNANGQGFKFQLGIEMDQVDFQKLSEELGTSVASPSSESRPHISSVKANMHTLQTIAETYAVDWGGNYPDNIEAMYEEATHTNYSPYWKDFKNPFTSKAGVGNRGSVMNYSEYEPSPDFAGMVLYSPITNTEYKIYGCDDKGELIQDKEQVFYLTNS